MPLPKQVQQDMDDLESYEKQLGAQPTGSETPTTPTEVVKPADPAEAAPPSVPAVPAAPAAPVDTKTPDEWEHKYRTLEGKYTAEVPRLHAQNKELATKLQVVEQQVAALKQPAPPVVPAVVEALVTDKDVQEYGADLIDVQRRVAREVMRDTVAPLRDELKLRDAKITELEQKLQTNSGAVATMSFEQRLAQEIPDFQALNTDPKWISWLDSEDPYTGEPRRAFAEFVYNSGDVAKLKRVVTQYKGVAATPNAAELERQKRQAELERQVTPTRTNSPSVDPQTTDTTVYTEAQMQQEFNKVRDLNRANKYEEAAKLEDVLSRAYMEGRVRA